MLEILFTLIWRVRRKNGYQIKTFTLSYASFMASDDLKDKFGTSDDENTSGDAEDPMDYLWMRVYGTSSSICEATGTSKVEVTGWKRPPDWTDL